MKLFREIGGGVAYLVGVSAMCMAFAVFWHDFSVSFHMAMHHETKHAKEQKIDLGCSN